jgi:hypothetical protein
MSRQRRLMALGFVVVAAAVGLSVWRPWQKPPPQPPINAPGVDPLNPASTVTLVVKTAGDPCTVTMTGRYSSTLDRSTFNKVAAGEARTRRVPGPYTLQTITVERGGKTHKQDLNVTIPGGQTREIWVNADDTVEVRPVP